MILAFSTSAFSQVDLSPFKNVREGESFYSKKSHINQRNKALKLIREDQLVDTFQKVLIANPKFCDYDIRNDLDKELKAETRKIKFPGVIYALRNADEIDDVAARILLNADKVLSTYINENVDEASIYSPTETKLLNQQVSKVSQFKKDINEGKCLDEAYKSYFSEQQKLSKKVSSHELQGIHYWGHKSGVISNDIYELLEKSRINKLNEKSLSLSTYKQKLKFLRTQFPLRDETERSNFSTSKVKKIAMSRRQKLYENYSDFQIVLMGKVIQGLRQRLEYDNVEIQGYYNGELQETIALEPMERFRFAIRVLRKEMTLLATNSYFNGYSPDYFDLMMASYEIGIIPASELEEVAGLEEIWNPKKTFWDKASVWVRLFSSVATIAIPPPYGFIPALVLVVIEASVGDKKDPNVIDPSVLF